MAPQEQLTPAQRLLKGVELESALFVEWLFGELFCLAADGSAEEDALCKASIAQGLRVVRLQRAWS